MFIFLIIIDLIHKQGKKAGISIKPGTPIEKVYPFLFSVDLVLIMTVEPGFGGQKFIDYTMDKIKAVRRPRIVPSQVLFLETNGKGRDFLKILPPSQLPKR